MTERSIDDAIANTRARLGSTLDAIDDKMNLPKQASALVERGKASYEANPLPWIVGATAAAIAIVGLVAWAIFSPDED
jgi:hypothetical protein